MDTNIAKIAMSVSREEKVARNKDHTKEEC
jgi:hypothetical protein